MLNPNLTLFATLILTAALAVGCSSEKSAKKTDEPMTESETMADDEMTGGEMAGDSMADEPESRAMMDEDNATDPVKGGPEGVEVAGYCPVAYKLAGKAVKGSEEFSSELDGKTYYFAGAKAKKAFDAAPEKFLVKFDGWCATGIAKGKKIPSDPTQFTVYEDTIYLFSSAEAKEAFDANPAKMAKKADDNWQSM